MRRSGVVLITVEAALGDRPFAVTKEGNIHNVQVRAGAESELWLKESLLNLGFKHLYQKFPEWQYAAWVDADIHFIRHDWAGETIEQLQHFKAVQPWSHAIDLGPKGTPFQLVESFCYSIWHDNASVAKTGAERPIEPYDETGRRHPGYAWAIRRDAFNKLGGLLDFAIMGACDWIMAWGFAGDIDRARDRRYGEAYQRRVLDWQSRCDRAGIPGDIGYCDGTITHYWHGKKRERFYVSRDVALISTNYNPDTDIAYDGQGLIVLTGANPALRDALRRYLRSRNEDSIDE